MSPARSKTHGAGDRHLRHRLAPYCLKSRPAKEHRMSQRTESRGLLTFVIIWFGQLVSELGSGLTGFGLGVYLYQETGSAVQFALNSFFYVLPVGLMAVFSGTLADRWSRRHILILADTGQALATLAI